MKKTLVYLLSLLILSTMILNVPVLAYEGSSDDVATDSGFYDIEDGNPKSRELYSTLYRDANYKIMDQDGNVWSATARQGNSFYINGSWVYCGGYTIREIIPTENQKIYTNTAQYLYSQPFSGDKFYISTIPAGTYKILYQSLDLYYISDGNISGWIEGYGGEVNVIGTKQTLETDNVGGLPVYTKIPEIGQYIRAGYGMKPQYVTIHNTANTGWGANASSHAMYLFNGEGRQDYTSWHFTVDNNEAWQSLPMNETGYHAGDGFGLGNTATIGLEIAENADGDYAKAERNAAVLTAYILKANGLPYDAIKMHGDWSGKHCPHNMLDGTSGSMGWEDFKSRVKTVYENIDQEVCGIYTEPPTTSGVVYTSYLKNTCYEAWNTNGAKSGKDDANYPLQGMRLKVNGYNDNAQITYRSYSDGAWQKWKGNGALSGSNKSTIEAFEIVLENVVGKKVEYRAKIDGIGWSSWKKNGEMVGSPGSNQAILSYEVKISDNPINVGNVTFTTLKKSGSDSMYLEWNAADNASGYNVYGYDEKTNTWKFIKGTTGLNTSIKGVQAGAFCRYRIRAFNNSRKDLTYYGNFSNSKSIVNLGSTKITNTTQNGNGIYITWDSVKGANVYQLYRYNELTKKWDFLKATTGTSTTDRNVISEGKEYYYKIRPVRLRNGVDYFGDYSNQERGIILSKPKLVKESQTTDSVKLNWDRVSGATGYNIYRYNKSTNKYEYLKSVTNARNYIDNNLSQGQVNLYLIKAYKKVNNGRIYYSNESNVISFYL